MAPPFPTSGSDRVEKLTEEEEEVVAAADNCSIPEGEGANEALAERKGGERMKEESAFKTVRESERHPVSSLRELRGSKLLSWMHFSMRQLP